MPIIQNFGALVGTTTNDNAPPGTIGEPISSSVPIGSSVAIAATGNTVNVTSILLTPGDWDVDGQVLFTPSTVGDRLQASGNTTTATLATAPANGYGIFTGTAGADTSVAVTRHRVSVAVATPYYLVARAQFSTGTMAVYGSIVARRVR